MIIIVIVLIITALIITNIIIVIRPDKTSNLHAHTKHRLEEGGRRHSEAAKEHSE